MLNLPPEPGATGYLLLALGALAGLAVILLGRRYMVRALGSDDRVAMLLLGGTLAITVAGAPFTLGRVLADIRSTAPLTPEHAEYVGAETKLIDGELVRAVEALIPEDASYYVRAAPNAYVEIRASLALWLGYELLPRRQVREPREAEWVVTWGARPDELGLRARGVRLVGRNRLSQREPVYLAESARTETP